MIERLRRALAPDYEIEREVAGGGMGVVFAARQTRLDRTVAIKILRPELATAVATERFLAEGRLLARLSHPAIVPIYDAGESDGLFYYVMEFVEGETLAGRLRREPLRPDEARGLARDLLSALAAAHARGVVHRDVKPANIFLRGGRALLGDFGIARWQERSDGGLTTPGQMIGTPRYMSPEQRDGLDATPETDVYQAALVLWEACTGERWPAYQGPEKADWGRIPRRFAPALRRALAIRPEERFADAEAFLAAVEAADGPGLRRRFLVGGLTALPVAVALWMLFRPPPVPVRPSGLTLRVVPFTVQGGRADQALGDSLTRAVTEALSGYADLRLVRAGDAAAEPGSARLSGAVILAGDSMRLELTATGGPTGGVVTTSALTPRRRDWPSLVRQAADSFLAEVWRGNLAGDQWLPIGALPKTGGGLSRWHEAERLYAGGQWEEASEAYTKLEAADTTCLLCTYRLVDIARWLSSRPEPARFAMLNRHLKVFPPHYREIIRAQQQPWPARFDSLKVAAERFHQFYLASFLLGDELFHRGPLHGHLRREAIEPLQHALALRPDFAPGWEHLAWVLLAEGGPAESTRVALDSVPPEPAGTGLSRGIRMMLQIGYAWRFQGEAEARKLTGAILAMPDVERDPRTPAGGRLMMTVDAPAGAVALGGALAAWRNRPDAVRAGLLAQAHGFAALGRLDSLRAVGTRLRQVTTDPSLGLYPLELEAALVLFDTEGGRPEDPGLVAALDRYAAPGFEAEPLRQRAAWMLAMLALRQGDSAGAARYRSVLTAASAPGLLRTEVNVFDALRLGDTARARGLLGTLQPSPLDSADPVPLEATVHRLLRAEWLARRGATAEARDALRWHEHLQLVDFPTGPPQAGEPAWALGTLLRWRRARFLESAGQSGPELCAVYAAVARLWAGGQPRFAARADTARIRLLANHCPPAA